MGIKESSDVADPCAADLERLRSLTCIKWTWYPDDVIPAWVADMDLEPCPSSVQAVRAIVERGDFGYNFSAHAALPGAFAEWQRTRHGWDVDEGGVRLFCDVMQAVETALWLHTDPGDGVVLFTPVYHPFYPAVRDNGRRVVECSLEPPDWSIRAEALNAVVDRNTKVILLCNPHNPTGRVFSAEELATIADVAAEHDLLVISDEIWADLTHAGHRHLPFAALSGEAAARTVTVTAASKAFNIAGLHCALAHVGHAGIRAGLESLPDHLLGGVGTPGAEATLAAWSSGAEWLGQIRAHLTSQRDHLARRLDEELPAARWTLPEATYLAWLDLRECGLGDDPAKQLLDRARVALSPGIEFGSAGAGFARLNFATSRELLDEIIDRLVAVADG